MAPQDKPVSPAQRRTPEGTGLGDGTIAIRPGEEINGAALRAWLSAAAPELVSAGWCYVGHRVVWPKG
jgi:hypothetical protein